MLEGIELIKDIDCVKFGSHKLLGKIKKTEDNLYILEECNERGIPSGSSITVRPGTNQSTSLLDRYLGKLVALEDKISKNIIYVNDEKNISAQIPVTEKTSAVVKTSTPRDKTEKYGILTKASGWQYNLEEYDCNGKSLNSTCIVQKGIKLAPEVLPRFVGQTVFVKGVISQNKLYINEEADIVMFSFKPQENEIQSADVTSAKPDYPTITGKLRKNEKGYFLQKCDAEGKLLREYINVRKGNKMPSEEFEAFIDKILEIRDIVKNNCLWLNSSENVKLFVAPQPPKAEKKSYEKEIQTFKGELKPITGAYNFDVYDSDNSVEKTVQVKTYQGIKIEDLNAFDKKLLEITDVFHNNVLCINNLSNIKVIGDIQPVKKPAEKTSDITRSSPEIKMIYTKDCEEDNFENYWKLCPSKEEAVAKFINWCYSPESYTASDQTIYNYYGLCGVGKTYLLKKINERIEAKEDICLYIDCNDVIRNKLEVHSKYMKNVFPCLLLAIADSMYNKYSDKKDYEIPKDEGLLSSFMNSKLMKSLTNDMKETFKLSDRADYFAIAFQRWKKLILNDGPDNQFVAVLNNLTMDYLTAAGKVLAHFQDTISRVKDDIYNEIMSISSAEVLASKLGVYLSKDINTIKERNKGKKLVIILDGLDLLSCKDIETLLKFMAELKDIKWVLGCRAKIERPSVSDYVVENVMLRPLTIQETMLEYNGRLSESRIQEIYRYSFGLPRHLEICTKESNISKPVNKISTTEISKEFLMYFSDEEQLFIKRLTALRFWNQYLVNDTDDSLISMNNDLWEFYTKLQNNGVIVTKKKTEKSNMSFFINPIVYSILMFGNKAEDIKSEISAINAKSEKKKRSKLMEESSKAREEAEIRPDKIDEKRYKAIAYRLLRDDEKISNEDLDRKIVQEMYYSIINGFSKKEISNNKSAILDNIIHTLNYNSVTLYHKFNPIGKLKGNEADTAGYGYIKKKVEEYIKSGRPNNTVKAE